jgi:hypothetical protein
MTSRAWTIRGGIGRFLCLLPAAGLLLFCFLTSVAPHPAMAAGNPDVWIGPDNDTPDLLDMFRQPQEWPKARSRIKVMKFGFQQLELGFAGPNTFADLKRVDAFRKLRAWGIGIASEEGAVKEWDCTGLKAAIVSERHIGNVAAAGASIDLIAMDEPLIAGARSCSQSVDQTAARTVAYINAVRTSDAVGKAGHAPAFGDIEAYPADSVATLENWTLALKRQGFTPAFFHLDIAGHYLSLHPEFDMPRDVRLLADFFAGQHIPFGIIFWSGVDELGSDKDYYDDTMIFVRTIKAAIGQPDQSIFQSWITRAPAGCKGPGPACQASKCTPSDGPLCGKRTIPLDLPESGQAIYSQTRLVDDAMAVLERK